MKKHTPYSDFIQQIPQLGNEFEDDAFLKDYLTAYVPEEILVRITPDLQQFGGRVGNEFLEWARDAELNQPTLTQFDACGRPCRMIGAFGLHELGALGYLSIDPGGTYDPIE